MEIKEIKEKSIWEKFVSKCEEKTFLNSWNWGEFQKTMGNKIWRFGIYENSELFSMALMIKVKAKRGTFFLVPHGPNTEYKTIEARRQILKALLDKAQKIAREEKVDFIRVNSLWERNETNTKIFKEAGFREAPLQIHPESSWKLDVRPSEEELLRGMRKTTRYLIRQAQRNSEIEIIKSDKARDIETFNKIHLEVVKTQNFVPFSLEYFRNEFLSFSKENQVLLFFGKYRGQVVASAFVIFWSNIAFYHHAGLLPEFHKIPVSYLLQWEIIKEVKKRGCPVYDFWGFVDPKLYPRHPWAGPTLFKMGFGGRGYGYVKTQDFPFSKKYYLTYFIEKLRKIKRGF